jgi:hypothetical protein
MLNKTLDFYVKWLATFIALLHVWLISHDIMPWYKYSGICAALLWTWLGFLWRQPSIWILNIIMVLIYLKGMFNL